MLEIIETDEFRKWKDSLDDPKIRAVVGNKINNIRTYGRFMGDFKPVGKGVVEIRVHASPGFRIYTAIQGRNLLILLGGTKHRQKQDIEKAKGMLREWRGA